MTGIIDRSAMPYRSCVGILVANQAGKVWVGRRNDAKGILPLGHLWQMPQGGIDKGEEPWPAAQRELFEETSITSIEPIAESPDWLTYELPDDILGKALKGKYRGQKQKWFAVRFTGDDSEIDILNPGDGNPPEFDDWRWAEVDELPGLIVPFKRPVYESVVAAFRDLV